MAKPGRAGPRDAYIASGYSTACGLRLAVPTTNAIRAALRSELPADLREARSLPFDRFASLSLKYRDRNMSAIELGGLSEHARVETLWTAHRAEQSGARSIDWVCLRRLVEWATETGLESFASTPFDELFDRFSDYCLGLPRAVGKKPSKDTVYRYRSSARQFQRPLVLRESDLEWWQHDTWEALMDERIPVPAGSVARSYAVVLADIEPVWLREAFRMYAHTGIVRGRISWSTLRSRGSALRKWVGPWLAEHSNGQPSLAASDAEIASLITRLYDHISEVIPGSATQIRSTVSTVFQQVCLERREATSYYPPLADMPDAAAFYAGNENTYKNRRATKKRSSKYVYLDDTAIANLLAGMPVLMAPRGEQVAVNVGRAKTVLKGCGAPWAARVLLIMLATGRRVSDVLTAPYDCIQPLVGTLTSEERSAAGDEDDRDPFVARWRYGTIKVHDGKFETIPIRRSTFRIIEEQRAESLAHVQQFHPDDEPEFVFIRRQSNRRGSIAATSGGLYTALNALTDQYALTDGSGLAISLKNTHSLRVTKITNLLDANVPVAVVQRYVGHHSAEMTMRYHRERDSVVIRELSKSGVLGAGGRQLDVDPTTYVDLSHLSGRTDRVLPNGLCLLPPTQTCDKGNACHTCPSFATHAGFIDVHREQLAETVALVAKRKQQHLDRTGQEMADTNIWLAERLKEIVNMERLITAMGATNGDENVVRGQTYLPLAPGDQRADG